MKLFENSIVYGPEKEGNGSPSLELSAQELGGLKRETEEIKEGEQGAPVGEVISAPESEAETEISLDALLGDLVGELQQEVEEANKPPFEIDEETGLSLQGQTVQEIQDRLVQLENRQATDIEESIHSSRGEERGQLQSVLEIAKTNRDNTKAQIEVAFDIALGKAKETNPNFSMTLEEFIAKKDTIKNIVDTNEKKVQEVEVSLATFEAETKRLIDETYEAEIQNTKDRLEPLKPEYEGSDAEKHDKQVLLEQKFTSIESFRTDHDMREFFEHYGYKEGKVKFEELKQQSKIELYSNSPVIQMYSEVAREQSERESNNLNQELRTKEHELSTIQSDEAYKQAVDLDISHDLYKLQLDIIKGSLEKVDFDIELTKEGFKVLGEKEIQDALDSLRQEIAIIQKQNAELLRKNGYEKGDSVRANKDLTNILSKLQSDLKQESDKKWFNPNKDQDKISRLTVLIETLKANQKIEEEQITKFSQIETDLYNKRSKLGDIQNRYEGMQPYTKNILQNAEDKSISGLISTIDNTIQGLENYTTPDDLIAKREHIAELREEIKILKSKQEDLRR